MLASCNTNKPIEVFIQIREGTQGGRFDRMCKINIIFHSAEIPINFHSAKPVSQCIHS